MAVNETTVGAACPKALLVEDDRDFGELLSVLIEREGIEVVRATTVAEAAEQLSAGGFAAVVLDFWLPDGDARDVLPLLGEPPSSPVLVVSAERRVHELLAWATVRRIFSKPLDTRTFRAELRQLAWPQLSAPVMRALQRH